jgi:hypothetical protein
LAGQEDRVVTIEDRFALEQEPRCCQCNPLDVARHLVLSRMPADAPCRRCWLLDTRSGIDRVQDRWPAGLFLDIARAIGAEPEEVVIIGEAWDNLYTVLDELILESRHTCPEGRRARRLEAEARS